jgi:CheY-like chemotaxis protein
VGRLAGGIAHDFNNLLTAIIGYSDLVLAHIDQPERDLKGEVEQIRRAAENAAALTAQLLAFTRQQALQPTTLDLNQLVDKLENMLRRLIGENIELETDLEPMLATVLADPNQLEQVVVNLVLNARDAMAAGGRLTIETANIEREQPEIGSHGAIPPGRYVALTVRDTGSGMAPDVEEKIFEPFFTTKEQGQGTGLGLATVYGIVRQSGGRISVRSIPGEGSSFDVFLPQSDVEPASARGTATPVDSLEGTETILVVEDADVVRTLVRRMLEQRGYTVLEAHDGQHALEVSERHPEPIQLLLVDVVMPKMSGLSLADRIRELRPEIRVLYMSGYTAGAIGDEGMVPEGTAFIDKPFTSDSLARNVREALDVARSRPRRSGVRPAGA